MSTKAPDDHRFSNRPSLIGAVETVIELDPVAASAASKIARCHLARRPPMQELMVHIHQVFMHEGVMTAHDFPETAGLIRSVVGRAQSVRRRRGRPRARPHEYHPVAFVTWIRAYAVWQLSFSKIRNINAPARCIVAPAVIATAHGAAINDALRQGHLPMGAAVFQGKSRPFLGAN